MTLKAQSAGGKARALQQRHEALDEYYKNPNKCLNCLKIIRVGNNKVCVVRRKKFCSHGCSSLYNGRKFGKTKHREDQLKKAREARINKPRVYKVSSLDNLTIGELRKKKNGSYFNTRAAICTAAKINYRSFSKPYFCKICGYDKYVEICHIKAVKDFSEDRLIKEVNGPENLVALCPNHQQRIR